MPKEIADSGPPQVRPRGERKERRVGVYVWQGMLYRDSPVKQTVTLYLYLAVTSDWARYLITA